MKQMNKRVLGTLRSIDTEVEFLQKRFTVLIAISDLISSSQYSLLEKTMPDVGHFLVQELERTRRHWRSINTRLNTIEKEIEAW